MMTIGFTAIVALFDFILTKEFEKNMMPVQTFSWHLREDQNLDSEYNQGQINRADNSRFYFYWVLNSSRNEEINLQMTNHETTLSIDRVSEAEQILTIRLNPSE